MANIFESDFVLEPSAGIGGLAVFAKAWGATVAVNELSDRRFTVLSSMGFDHVFRENAEHIDDVLPDEISPSVVIMNPPFSSTAGRTKNNKTSNAEKHIDSALARLRQGGRLVAILGKGMTMRIIKNTGISSAKTIASEQTFPSMVKTIRNMAQHTVFSLLLSIKRERRQVKL